METRLVNCKNGIKGTIEKVAGGNGALKNIQKLGLNIDDKFEIININPERGPVELVSHGNQILLGRELAAKIIVKTESDFSVTLDMLRSGDIAEVTKIQAGDGIKVRLIDMGLVRGVKLKVIRYAPLGDPIEIQMKGFNLSLRIAEAKCIEVKMISVGRYNNGKFGNWLSFGKN